MSEKAGRTVRLSPDLQSGKAATKALIRAFGGQEAASEETGYRRQRVSDFGLPNVQEFAPLDFIALLEERTVGMPGWPHVTNWLAQRTGHVLVKRADGVTSGDGLLRSVMVLNAELGDLSRCLEEATRDGEVDGDEAVQALAELSDLETQCAALRLQLLKLAERY